MKERTENIKETSESRKELKEIDNLRAQLQAKNQQEAMSRYNVCVYCSNCQTASAVNIKVGTPIEKASCVYCRVEGHLETITRVLGPR